VLPWAIARDRTLDDSMIVKSENQALVTPKGPCEKRAIAKTHLIRFRKDLTLTIHHSTLRFVVPPTRMSLKDNAAADFVRAFLHPTSPSERESVLEQTDGVRDRGVAVCVRQCMFKESYSYSWAV